MKTSPSLQTSPQTASAFTLIELLVVMVIIAVLAAILLPVFSKMQNNAANVNDTNSLKQIAAGLAGYMADNNQKIPVSTDPISGTSTGGANPDRWTFQEAVDRYLPKSPKFNSSSIYNFYLRPKIWCSKMAKPYPGWTSSNTEPSPLAYSWNPNIANGTYWAGSMLKVPNPAQTVIMGEVNGSAGNMYPDRVATFSDNVDCRYRIARGNQNALYLFGDFHIAMLQGDRGYAYYAKNPNEPNIWRWW